MFPTEPHFNSKSSLKWRGSTILRSHTPKEIQEKLSLKFDKKFEYSKVRNAYYKTKQKLFGRGNNEAHDLIQLLEELKKSEFIDFDVKFDPHNKDVFLDWKKAWRTKVFFLFTNIYFIRATPETLWWHYWFAF